MRHVLAIAIVCSACRTGSWNASGFSGSAPEPVATTPVVLCPGEVGPHVNDLVLNEFERAVSMRAGEVGRATGPGGNEICHELGSVVRGVNLDTAQGTEQLVRQLAGAHHARTIVIPVIAQETYCQNETRAIRDRNNVQIGSIDTGGEVCQPGMTQYRLFVFAADGKPLWYRWAAMPPKDLRDSGELLKKATELVTAAPAMLEHHPDEPAPSAAVATAYPTGAQPPSPAYPAQPSPPQPAYPAVPKRTLDASAPASCKTAFAMCGKQAVGMVESCKTQILMVVQYQPANTATTTCDSIQSALRVSAPR